ncbi:hypothetical protein Tco_0722152 [Tanacetum coccineum]
MQARIKILEKDVQRCQKQSVDFELKLQHEKEKGKWESSLKNDNANSLGRQSLDYSWISKMEKLENENVSLDFKVQSLIKERDNVKLEYQKLFDSTKKTQSQTQKEMNELIDHVSEKTYAYGWSNCSVDLNVSVAMYGNVFICVCVGYVRLDNQSIERDHLIGIGFVLNFVKFISFTFGDKKMISVIKAVSRTCYVRNLEGDDLLTGGRESNLYTISISDMAASSPVCLILDLVDGLPKFKYGKDHLCSAFKRGKSKKASHPPKLVPSDHSKLELLHMDLCGPMRVVRSMEISLSCYSG